MHGRRGKAGTHTLQIFTKKKGIIAESRDAQGKPGLKINNRFFNYDHTQKDLTKRKVNETVKPKLKESLLSMLER